MNVTVKLFAAARDAAGSDSLNVAIAADAPTVGDLRKALCETHPELKTIVSHSMFAINEEYRPDDAEIPAAAAVVCIPPVSGG